MNKQPYSPIAQLGAGADGSAFRAAGPEGEVELRLLGPAWADPLRREALLSRIRRARLVSHPSVRPILAVGLDSVPPWLALGPALGRPLREAVSPPQGPAAVTCLLSGLADALRAAHRVGACHGRLSPDAVFIVEGGVQIELAGTCILASDGPVPSEAPASDVAGLARVASWLLTGKEDGDLSSVAAPLRALLTDALQPEEDRPSITELTARLAQLVAVFGAGLSDTAQGEAPGGFPPPARETPTVLGRYRILERLGRGGMGEVFRAEDMGDGRVVAIKTLLPMWASQPEAVRRFRKEARLLEQVNNPHVANLLEVNEDGGTHYLAVEFVAGRSVSRLLEEGKPLPEAFALAVAGDVCRALVSAHGRGIIHRDIKPENVLLLGEDSPAGQVAKLSDFGLARELEQSESLNLTRTGAVVGTPLYMSPEQCRGEALSPASDVYSLGATLFHLLTGRAPFTGDGALALIHHHCNTPPPSPQAIVPAVSDGASRVVLRAMAKEPGHRHADAAEMLADIERLARGEPSSAQAHPLLPACDPANVVKYEFQWELEASPAQLWPYVSNTERLNRAIGLAAVQWETRPDDAGKVRRHGKFTRMGIEAAWEEHPFEWVEGKRFGVLRQCSAGPVKWILSEVSLVPKGAGTALTHTFRLEPAGWLSRMFLALELGIRTRSNLDQVYRRIDRVVRAGQPLADGFEDAPGLSRAQRRRLDEGLATLAKHVPAAVAEALGQYLTAAPAQELARIRPVALARRLGLAEDQMVTACLHAAGAGLLVLMWDLLCPLCRIPSQALDSLRAMKQHGRCEACNLDYELDFARSVEAVFRAHPSVREAELGVYCIGGPAHSPHVVAQLRVAPGERVEVPLSLGEGAYKLRGPQLPTAALARVASGERLGRWEVDLSRLPREPLPVRLRPGGQMLEVTNPLGQELVVRLERTAARDDALTAARAVSLALFRELFGGEVLSAGQLVSVASVCLVRTDLPLVREVAEAAGEARAFTLLREHLHRLEALAKKHQGSLVKAVGEGGLLAFEDAVDAMHVLLELGEAVRAVAYRGPSMAATVNGQLDYFGAGPRLLNDLLGTVRPGEFLLTQGVMDVPGVGSLLRAHGKQGAMSTVGEGAVHRFGA